MLALTDCVVVNCDLLSADLDGEMVMMDIASGQYYGLNDVGSRLWQEMATPTAVESLCRRLEADYDASPAVIQQGVLRFLGAMLEKHLVRVVA